MTINELQDSIIKDFSQLADWFQKYEYLSSLGKTLNSFNKEIRKEQYILQGCQSQVWLYAYKKNDKLFFIADSDSLIMKGILALLIKILNNQSPADIAAADLYFLKQIGFNTNLSPARINGLVTIINQMKNWGKFFQDKTDNNSANN